MKNNIKLAISIVLLLICMIVIFIFSNTPGEESNQQSLGIVHIIKDKTIDGTATDINHNQTPENSNNVEDILNFLLRKCAHATVYLVLAIITTTTIIQLNKKPERRCYILAVIFCFIYAITDEYHQLFVNGRSGEFRDVLIDTSGAIIGVICVWIFLKIRNRIRTNKANKTITTKNK